MASNTGKDKRALMTMTIAILLLTLMGAGIGFAVGLVLRDRGQAETTKAPEGGKASVKAAENTVESAPAHGEAGTAEEKESTAGTEESNEDIPLKDLKVIPFPPILTTLAEPKGKWIRLEGALLAVPGSEKAPELLAEETGEQILAYLRTLRLAEIETASGFLGLRDDLNETVKIMSEGQVRGVLIHGLIVE